MKRATTQVFFSIIVLLFDGNLNKYHEITGSVQNKVIKIFIFTTYDWKVSPVILEGSVYFSIFGVHVSSSYEKENKNCKLDGTFLLLDLIKLVWFPSLKVVFC